MRTLLHTLAALAVVLAGCGSDNKGGDAAVDGPTVTPPPATVRVNNMDMPANYACNGMRMDPPGAAAEFTINGTVTAFSTGDKVAGAVVSVYADTAALLANMPFDTKTCNNMGAYMGLRIPANHYRVVFKNVSAPDFVDTYEFGIPIAPGTTSRDNNIVSKFIASSIAGVVGISLDTSKALIAGGVRDCGPAAGGAGRFVKGALINGTVGGTPVDDALVFYFSDSGLPIRRTQQQWTNADGLFTVVNSPTGMATVEAKAVLTAGGPLTKVGSEMVPLIGGSLSIVDVPPLAR